MDCVFCQIFARQIPASFVYEDKDVFAIMSLEQPNPYKVLVIPRRHVRTIYELDDELAAYIFQVSVKVARAIREASNCDGLNLVQSNDRVGQQDVFHFHLHLIPRFEEDQITLNWDNTISDREILDQYAKEIRKHTR